MKKILLFLLSFCLMPMMVMASEATNAGFEDEALFNCVLSAIGNNATSATDEQLASITQLRCSNKEITSVKGIEKLTALTGLTLSNNNISSIDLSHNTALKELFLDGNNLSSINVSANTGLTHLWLNNNNISDINLASNTALSQLNLSENSISSINLETNRSLTKLLMMGNNLTTIDLSENVNLINVDLRINNLNSITLPRNGAIKVLQLDYNDLNSLDVSGLANLETLSVEFNPMSDLAINNNMQTLSLNYDLFISGKENINSYTSLSTINLVYYSKITKVGTTIDYLDIVNNLPEEVKNSNYEIRFGYEMNDDSCRKDTCPSANIKSNTTEVSINSHDVSYSDITIPNLTINFYGEYEIIYKSSTLGAITTGNSSTSKKDSIAKNVSNREESTSSTDNSKTNPETGMFIPIVSLSIIGVLGIIIYNQSSKRRLFVSYR